MAKKENNRAFGSLDRDKDKRRKKRELDLKKKRRKSRKGGDYWD